MLKQYILICLLITINCFAQEKTTQEENDFGVWGNIGFGVSSLNGQYESRAYTTDYGINAKYGVWTVSFQKRQFDEFLIIGTQKLKSTSILAGVSGDIVSSKEGVTKICYLALIGISFINTDGYKEIPNKGLQYTNEKITGFPVEVGLKINLTKVIGITLTANANFNKYANTLGGNLNFIFGKL